MHSVSYSGLLFMFGKRTTAQGNADVGLSSIGQ